MCAYTLQHSNQLIYLNWYSVICNEVKLLKNHCARCNNGVYCCLAAHYLLRQNSHCQLLANWCKVLPKFSYRGYCNSSFAYVPTSAQWPGLLQSFSWLYNCKSQVVGVLQHYSCLGYCNRFTFLGTSTTAVARVGATFQLWVAVIVQLPGILLQFGFLCCYNSTFGWVTATAQLTGVLQHLNFRVSVVGLLHIYTQLNGSLQTVQLLKLLQQVRCLVL